jgi:hypothetical protein
MIEGGQKEIDQLIERGRCAATSIPSGQRCSIFLDLGAAQLPAAAGAGAGRIAAERGGPSRRVATNVNLLEEGLYR